MLVATVHNRWEMRWEPVEPAQAPAGNFLCHQELGEILKNGGLMVIYGDLMVIYRDL